MIPRLDEMKKDIMARVEIHSFKEITKVLFENKEFIKKLRKNKLISKNLETFIIRGLNNWTKIDRYDTSFLFLMEGKLTI